MFFALIGLSKVKLIRKYHTIFVIAILLSNKLLAIDYSSQIGSWYSIIYDYHFSEKGFGIEGDIHLRQYQLSRDYQQFIFRLGQAYTFKKSRVMIVSGYGYFENGVFGESLHTIKENRIYQDLWVPQKISIINAVHRFRAEQRFIEASDFRTRWRYAFFLNIPLTGNKIKRNTLYFSFYNELFINGESKLNETNISYFDRNWMYFGLGYAFTEELKIQFAYHKEVTKDLSKNQLQLSFHIEM